MTNGWLKEMDNSKMTGVGLLDFSAVLDVIDHNLFITKLKAMDLDQVALPYLVLFIKRRT